MFTLLSVRFSPVLIQQTNAMSPNHVWKLRRSWFPNPYGHVYIWWFVGITRSCQSCFIVHKTTWSHITSILICLQRYIQNSSKFSKMATTQHNTTGYPRCKVIKSRIWKSCAPGTHTIRSTRAVLRFVPCQQTFETSKNVQRWKWSTKVCKHYFTFCHLLCMYFVSLMCCFLWFWLWIPRTIFDTQAERPWLSDQSHISAFVQQRETTD